jgi:hypothetical protein
MSPSVSVPVVGSFFAGRVLATGARLEHAGALEGFVAEYDQRESLYEWSFVTYDIDAACSECGKPIRAGQAVGHAGSRIIHAKCFKASESAA